MAGNKLGPKGKFLYFTDDVTVAYILNRDLDLVFAGLGAAAAAPVAFDPANLPAGVTVSPKPTRFTPRGVYIQDSSTGERKFLIAFHPTSDIYLAQVSQTIPDIDGETDFVSTGRKGEQLSF